MGEEIKFLKGKISLVYRRTWRGNGNWRCSNLTVGVGEGGIGDFGMEDARGKLDGISHLFHRLLTPTRVVRDFFELRAVFYKPIECRTAADCRLIERFLMTYTDIHKKWFWLLLSQYGEGNVKNEAVYNKVSYFKAKEKYTVIQKNQTKTANFFVILKGSASVVRGRAA